MNKGLSSAFIALATLLAFISCKDEASRRSPTEPHEAYPTGLQATDPCFSGDNSYVHCASLCALGPRPSGSAAYARQLEYLAQQLQVAGWVVRQQPFSLSNGLRMVNLHATYTPSNEAKEALPQEASRPLLISCHIDTKQGIPGFVGADDGASAAAVMLELARVLAAHPELATQIELAFFDGEESFAPHMTDTDGLYGSRFDVLRRKRAHALPRWQINLDMVGGRNKTIAVPIWDSDAALLEHYATAIEALHLSTDRWTLHPGSYLDDHRPFAEAGVATLNLIAQFQQGGWWHTPKDNLSRISPASLGETGSMVLQLIRQLLTGKD